MNNNHFSQKIDFVNRFFFIFARSYRFPAHISLCMADMLSYMSVSSKFTVKFCTIYRMQEKADRKNDKKYSLEYYRRMGIAHEIRDGKDYYMVVLER